MTKNGENRRRENMTKMEIKVEEKNMTKMETKVAEKT